MENSTNLSLDDIRNEFRQFLSQSNSSTKLAVFWTLYSVISAIGVVGNASVILVIARSKSMWSSRNLLIGNLALADLIQAATLIPFFLVPEMELEWTFGSFWCKFYNGFSFMNICCSALSVAMISVERSLAVRSMRINRSTRNLTAFGMVLTIWTFSAIFAIPLLIFCKVTPVTHRDFVEMTILEVCSFTPPPGSMINFLVQALQLVFLYPLPLLIVIVVNAQLHRFLKRGQFRLNRWTTDASGRRGGSNSYRCKTSRLLLLMVLVHALLWLPFTVLYLLADFAPQFFADSTLFQILHLSFQALAYTSVCMNPFLYAFLNSNFNKQFRQLFSCSRAYTAVADAELPMAGTSLRFSVGNVTSCVHNL